MEGRTPRVSILVPFWGDPRGEPRHLISWTRKQTVDSALTEIVVPFQNISATCERSIAEILRPQDRMFPYASPDRVAGYQLAAEQATGEILLITEDHCVADPGCVARVLDYLDTTGLDATMMGAGHIDRNSLARLEHLAYDRHLALWLAEDHWDKVRFRGFAIRRNYFQEVGGLPSKYGYFAEALVSMRIRTSGHKVGYIPELGVRHVNTMTWSHLQEDVKAYSIGECIYRDEEASDVHAAYLGNPLDWAERRLNSRANCIALVGMLVRTILDGTGHARFRTYLALIRETLQRLVWGVLGPGLRPVGVFLELLLLRLRFMCPFFAEEKRLDAFICAWETLRRYYRLQYYISQLAETASNQEQSCEYCMSRTSPRQLCGFSSPETYDGRVFRWTNTVARLRANVLPGDYVVRIDTIGVRDLRSEIRMGFFFNGSPISRVQIDGNSVLLPIEGELFVPDEQEITIVCAPMPLPPESTEIRQLGLPVARVHFIPAAA